MPSPFKFGQHGESGLWISELFPKIGSIVADDCASFGLAHRTSSSTFRSSWPCTPVPSTVPMPSIGAWLSYGLGTLNPSLPSYVVLCEHLPYAGSQVWDSNFLPPMHQGMRIMPGDEPIPDLNSPLPSVKLRELEQIDASRCQPGACRGPARRSESTATHPPASIPPAA